MMFCRAGNQVLKRLEIEWYPGLRDVLVVDLWKNETDDQLSFAVEEQLVF
jgi:hypothetical protein